MTTVSPIIAPTPKKAIFRTALVVFFLVSFVFAFSRASHATFLVLPSEVRLNAVQPGARVAEEFEVYNGDDVPVYVVSYAVDWTLSKTGDYQFSEAGTQSLSCAKWIQFNPGQFSLAPRTSMRVRININTPQDFTREHWAMIFFQTRPVPLKGNSMGLNMSMRIGANVFITPPRQTEPKIQVQDIELQSGPATSIKLTLGNSGVSSARVEGTVEVAGAQGPVFKGSLKSGRIMPESEREWTINLDKPLPPGEYSVKAAVDYGGKSRVGGALKATVTASEVAADKPPVAELVNTKPGNTTAPANNGTNTSSDETRK